MKHPRQPLTFSLCAEGAEHLAILEGSGCTIEAAADAAAPPKISMNVYNGGPIRPRVNPPLKYPVVVDLAGLEVPADQRPILKDHNPQQHVGHTTAFLNDGTKLDAEGVASGTGPAAREVVASAKNGFKWQVSFGLAFGEPDLLPAGQTQKINGQLVAGPVYVVRSSRVREVSLLTLGADDTTSARIAANAANGVPMTFEQWLKAKGFTLDALNDQQKQTLEAAFNAEAAAAADKDADKDKAPAKPKADDKTLNAAAGGDDEDPVKASRKALVAERKRQSAITSLSDEYKGQVKADKLATLEASALDDEWTADRYELALLREARPQASANNSGGGRSKARTLEAAVVVAAMSLTAGINEAAVAKQLPTADRERVMNVAASGEMRGYSLHALMDAVIMAAGQHYNGSRKSDAFIRTALEAERTLHAEGFSTLSLSGVLSNVANKGLIAAYTAVEVTWNQFCAVRSHNDFKVHTRYRLDATGAFKKVGPDGELKNVGLVDSSFTNQVATYGAIISLTRQMQINDDLGAFMDIPNFLGRMSALRVEEGAFVTLLASIASTLISTGNKNYLTGVTVGTNDSRLNIEGLTRAEQAFRDQVDSNGKPVLVSPNRILVGNNQKVTAENLFAEKLLIADNVGTSSSTQKPNRNPFAGKYPPTASPYISNTSITDQDGAAISGQTQTGWGMFSDPAIRAALAVAFLNGQQTPTIQSAETDFSTLGMQWRAFHDFGFGLEDPKAVVWSKGAA
jgi:hypothetical protein